MFTLLDASFPFGAHLLDLTRHVVAVWPAFLKRARRPKLDWQALSSITHLLSYLLLGDAEVLCRRTIQATVGIQFRISY